MLGSVIRAQQKDNITDNITEDFIVDKLSSLTNTLFMKCSSHFYFFGFLSIDLQRQIRLFYTIRKLTHNFWGTKVICKQILFTKQCKHFLTNRKHRNCDQEDTQRRHPLHAMAYWLYCSSHRCCNDFYCAIVVHLHVYFDSADR